MPSRKAPTQPRLGRKTPDGAEDLARHLVMLDPKTVTRLRALGDGNLSAGIRKAASRIKLTIGG